MTYFVYPSLFLEWWKFLWESWFLLELLIIGCNKEFSVFCKLIEQDDFHIQNYYEQQDKEYICFAASLEDLFYIPEELFDNYLWCYNYRWLKVLFWSIFF